MSRFLTNREMIFIGPDLGRPRMGVEKKKMARFFPGFEFYGNGVRVTSVQGRLRTSYGNSYYVKIKIGRNYPYELPDILLPHDTIDPNCAHKYDNERICVMKTEQWSSTLSLAFLVAKTAVWLNKYDSWRRTGKIRWPGKDQHR